MDKPLKVRLHILSPVHIGCDDVYEPTNFVIDENKRQLIEFDTMDFVESLDSQQRNELLKICSSDSLLDIFKFIRKAYSQKLIGREVNIASGLLEHYKKMLGSQTYNKNTVINQFTMNKTAYNPYNSLPYIPGSSIKGALRTAYLSKLAKDKGIKSRKDKANKLESELLEGVFSEDPFSMVKVSDFMPVENVKTKIIYAVNKKKKKNGLPTKAESGPPQIFEVVEPDAIFEGIVNIEKPESKRNIKKPITAKELLKAVNDVYLKIANDENNILKNINAKKLEFKTELNGKFLIRIGRHSGAEAVTIEDNRQIKIITKQGSYNSEKGATTIWLASETSRSAPIEGLVPFGWAMLELTELDVKSPYPATITPKNQSRKESLLSSPSNTKDAPAPAPKQEAQTVEWENATLSWSPGNRTLTAEKDGRKALIVLDADRGLVPIELHKKLFDKKDNVKINVTVEVDGNSCKVIKVG